MDVNLQIIVGLSFFSVRFCGFDFGAIISHHHTFITRCFLKRANEQITQNLSTFALPRTSNLPTYVYLTDFQSLEHGLESKIGLMGKSSFISKKPITSMENCDWKNVYLCDRYTQECQQVDDAKRRNLALKIPKHSRSPSVRNLI